MFILHGLYSFGRKIVAYRNDFCLSCAAPRRAFRVRTFDVVHIFYVPLIPLGFLRRWHCSVCGRDPHAHPGTRKGFKWAGVVVLALFAVFSWALPPEDDAWVWPMRVGLPIAFAAALWHTLKSKPDVRLKDKLREVQPADESVCPLCGYPLVIGSGWHCSGCGVERKVVKV
ncbi:MAG: hypothetical protein LAO78_24275 [Acidobacteriia bacterium]|nr:hypothetical protein [Terriglobia bacterium]